MARRADAMNGYFDHWAIASYPFIPQRIQLPDPCQSAQSGRSQRSGQDVSHGMELFDSSCDCLDYVRTLSEPLHRKIRQGDTSVLGSGSDRAVRRKPVVRSGRDVWGYGFSTALII